jgi:hypothetical protein
VSYHLPALDEDETAAYINHRLARAAAGVPIVFPQDVSTLVHKHSRGVPRRINVVADAILLYGYGEGQSTIDLDLAHKAIEELVASGILMSDLHTVEQPPAPVLAAPPATPAGRTTTPTAAVAPMATPPAADLIAREERVLIALQRLLAEQNHLLQLHREQLVEVMSKVARTPQAPVAPPPAITRSSTAATAPAASTPNSTPASAAARPAPVASTAALPQSRTVAPVPTPWPTTTAQPRILAPAQTSGQRDGLWTRLGRNLFGTVSPAYKD